MNIEKLISQIKDKQPKEIVYETYSKLLLNKIGEKITEKKKELAQKLFSQS